MADERDCSICGGVHCDDGEALTCCAEAWRRQKFEIAALRARAEKTGKERDEAVDRVAALTIAIELHCPNVAEAMAFAETYGTFRDVGEAMRVEDEKARAEQYLELLREARMYCLGTDCSTRALIERIDRVLAESSSEDADASKEGAR